MATIILAGGLSIRMGRDKSSLSFGDSNIIDILVSRFHKIGPVIVVCRQEQNLEIEHAIIANDLFYGKGPLGGLHAGLLASPDERNFVIACDMPFADPTIAQYLMDRLDEHDAVVPMVNQRPEPLHAMYRRSCLKQIQTNLNANALRIRELLEHIDTLYINEDDLRSIDTNLNSFTNINTPEEYAEICKRVNPL